jgi:hypothetical protein
LWLESAGSQILCQKVALHCIAVHTYCINRNLPCALTEMAGKLHELKETTTDAVNIIKELRDPEVQKTIENIKIIASTVNNIVAVFMDPQFAKNTENINQASNHIKETIIAVQNTAAELNKAGTMNEVTQTIKSIRMIVESFSEVKTKGGMIVSITNLLLSVKQVLEEAQNLRNTPRILSATQN